MQKFTTTHFYKLIPGDRFYKAKDKSKKVFEVVEAEKKVTPFRTYSYWAKQDGSDVVTAFAGNTEVVFLRHNEAVPIKPKPPFKRLKSSLDYYNFKDALNRLETG